VLLDAFFEAAGQKTPFGRRKSPLARLQTHFLGTTRLLSSDHGRVLSRLIMAIQEDDWLRQSFLERYLLPRRAAVTAVVKAAAAAGELPPGVDPELWADALYGPLYARLFLGYAPLGEAFAKQLFELVIHGPNASA
jgi:hypothetical protein